MTITVETNVADIAAGQAIYNWAVAHNADNWVAACGGAEVPFRARSGRVLLYCYNPRLNRHAFLDLAADYLLSDEEAGYELATR